MSVGVVDAYIDVPTRPKARVTTVDRIFRMVATTAASISLLIVVATLVFLVDQARPAIEAAGVWNFVSTSVWNPTVGRFGVFGLLVGTMIIATIAVVIAVPASLGMAIFVNEYAPAAIRRPLTSVIDLLAALPSLLFGIWGFFAFKDQLIPVAGWMTEHLSVLPIFQVSSQDASLVGSAFDAGFVVAIMILPIITSVSRDVMAQVPREQCEGALALGGTRWGMIRDVVLPFGRSGIIGAVLLGFGRALGETIAVALIISTVFPPNYHVLERGAGSIAATIAVKFGEAGELERSALVAIGLALFLLTLAVNLIARYVANRSRVV